MYLSLLATKRLIRCKTAWIHVERAPRFTPEAYVVAFDGLRHSVIAVSPFLVVAGGVYANDVPRVQVPEVMTPQQGRCGIKPSV